MITNIGDDLKCFFFYEGSGPSSFNMISLLSLFHEHCVYEVVVSGPQFVSGCTVFHQELGASL